MIARSRYHSDTVLDRIGTPREQRLPNWVRVCNCARCARILLGQDQPEKPAGFNIFDIDLPGVVRWEGRPYCVFCLRIVRPDEKLQAHVDVTFRDDYRERQARHSVRLAHVVSRNELKKGKPK